MKPEPARVFRLLPALVLVVLPACNGMKALISDDEPDRVLTAEQEPKRYLDQDTPIDTDLGAGQKYMLTEFVELKERNQELTRERDKLQRALTETERRWREAEAERVRERNDKLSAQAQLGTKDQELRKLQACILDLQIQRSRLQQKVYLAALAGRGKELESQLRVGQGLSPDEDTPAAGR
ncbi:MAG: hypothetical protein R3F30_09650 [Planctomycetota bacterium]